jgi:TPR repeat protein
MENMAGNYELVHIPKQGKYQRMLSGDRVGLIARGRKDATAISPRMPGIQQPIDLKSFEFVVLDFDREDIASGNTSSVMDVLTQLLERDAAIRFCERVDVCCTGYDSDPRELWEIPEVREFVKRLDRQFPYWCYFLSRNGEGLLWLTYCLYPLAQTQDEKQRLWLPAIRRYIEDRGIPQMTAMCRYVGCSDEEAIRLTNGAINYLVYKPQGKYVSEPNAQRGNVHASDRFPMAAERSDVDAQYFLGSLYYEGNNPSENPEDHVIQQDYALAELWFLKAASKGHAAAQYHLGVIYYVGQGTQRDFVKAAEWFYKAADQGLLEAQCYLGYLYQQGEGVPLDYGKGAAWFRKAADQGYAAAQFNLGYLYSNGQGVPQDYTQAADLYRAAASQGDENAQFALGVLYEEGKGVQRDYAQAATYYRKAADQGLTDAKASLDLLYSKRLLSRR